MKFWWIGGAWEPDWFGERASDVDNPSLCVQNER